MISRMIKSQYDVNEKVSNKVVDLSVNVNPLGMPESVKALFKENLGDLCEQYPDGKCYDLAKIIARHKQVFSKNVLCVAGVDDAVYRIVYAKNPRKALLLAPTYEDYERALVNVKCEINYHVLKKENNFQITETILDELTADIEIFFLCNPNNPTGKVIPKDLLLMIVQHCSINDIMIIIDESFIGFLDEPEHFTAKNLIKDYKNLIIIDGFSKLYAMPGIRLGFCLSSDEAFLEQMFLAGQVWNISAISQLAGIYALNDCEYLEKTHDFIIREKRWLLKELLALEILVIGNDANYIFFEAPFPNTRERLRQDNILLRDCKQFKGLANEFCRVAIKSKDENRKFIQALKKLKSI